MTTSTPLQMHPTLDQLLSTLNTNQHQAVTAHPFSKLQIIAGPGTGKTKVITSRVAYLLLDAKIPPENIIVTTFTKKAANEMIERLRTMLDNMNLDKLMIGTFHSICFRLIMRYGKPLGLSGFGIADERDKEFYVKEILNELNAEERELFSGREGEKFKGGGKTSLEPVLIPGPVISLISSLKSQGITSDQYSQSPSKDKCLSLLYSHYQSKLQENRVLDFDDCLLKCHELVSKFPLTNIEHVLVDEFQDTNEIQLQLMYKFGTNVTIVGDPDQSIYAFRNAQVINFQKMIDYYQRQNQQCSIITLDHNYRSTNDILIFSESVMKQEKERKSKQLVSQHTNDFGSPIYAQLKSEYQEAKWIALQITTLLSLPTTPIHPQDIAILVRSAYQTRVIETELNSNGIPYHMIRGKAFWSRKEVTVMMDYLRIIANENDRVAVLRTINYPKRGIGEKTLEKIDEYLKLDVNHSVYEKLRFAVQGGVNLSSKVQSNISKYLNTIQQAKEKLDALRDDHTKLPELFDFITSEFELTKEWEPSQVENINEIKKLLSEFTPPSPDDDIPPKNILGQFIDSMGLNEAVEEQKQSRHAHYKGQVALSTIHGAKGLEWPVVFVPGLSDGLLPSIMAIKANTQEAIDEERRCLYVALTRAKLLLYVSWYVEDGDKEERQSWRMQVTDPSRFIEFIKNKDKKTGLVHIFRQKDKVKSLYEILGKRCPDFDLDEFNTVYKEKMNSILNPFNPKGIVDGCDNGADKKVGFQSASDVIHTTQNKKQKFEPGNESVTNKLGGTQPHRKGLYGNLTKDKIKPMLRKTGTQLISKPSNNKAPPYVPSRRPGSSLGTKRVSGPLALPSIANRGKGGTMGQYQRE
ncbi:uncharacterized protein SPAPADRAFT_51438 [Spathaspora passalidarum NRRL Y-27907]|uniref:DNA 3'-5' helicase n=1 Tax=Spathaspora passalidarum (strain NRRL Y-27907 / 11-Y1) TaxID=619300 RepID=G3AQ74_SPAPN|nr:uncharacterized protein SPAPADRAFT_51438 [Spathaspora passalidarum NRRL Y-27907]EGW31421.1 hypothetical protein SPAPADRAFT_51438 [Spathaspora passalidarum NRRL Y-27907]